MIYSFGINKSHCILIAKNTLLHFRYSEYIFAIVGRVSQLDYVLFFNQSNQTVTFLGRKRPKGADSLVFNNEHGGAGKYLTGLAYKGLT